MKDDEIKDLFAYGWLDTALAIVLALLALVHCHFLRGI